MANQCPYCLASLVGVPAYNGTISCPTCGQYFSELETLSVATPPSDTKSAKPESTNKWLIPLGYAAFVIVPVLIATYLLFSYFGKPAEAEADKGTPPTDPTTQIAKTNTEQVPKKNQTPPSNEKPTKISSTTSDSVSDWLKQKPDTTSKPKSNGSTKSNTEVLPDSKDDILPMVSILEVAPPPRTKLVFGTLRLVTPVAVKDGVEAWVEIDGKKEKAWKVGSFQVELKLATGDYMVKVIAVYKGVRRTIYEGEVEIIANKLKEVSVDPSK